MTTRLATAATAVLLLAGCGGDKPADEVIKEFYEASDRADVDKACGDLVTEGYLREKSGGRTGEAAREACAAQLEALEPAEVRVRAIPFLRERGDTVTAVVELEVDGRGSRHNVVLRRDGGELRVHRAG